MYLCTIKIALKISNKYLVSVSSKKMIFKRIGIPKKNRRLHSNFKIISLQTKVQRFEKLKLQLGDIIFKVIVVFEMYLLSCTCTTCKVARVYLCQFWGQLKLKKK